MILLPKHLRYICGCELTMFNRQRWRISTESMQRIIIDEFNRKQVISKKILRNSQEQEQFFNQIKTIWFDNKIVAFRSNSRIPLKISNMIFAKMNQKRKFLIQADACYRKYQREERKKWIEFMKQRGNQQEKKKYIERENIN
ncbi:type III secretion system protein PrgR [Enterococcus faecium]|nr:type III secretion system protein PrgR [Enterococcus faecium]EMF0115952.1 type III secretion system protein PrgR [Enterococcus hirae]